MHYNLYESRIVILKEFCLGIHMYIHLSYTFDRLGKILTGREFSMSALSFFKKMGVIFEFCKYDGKFELNRELLKLL